MTDIELLQKSIQELGMIHVPVGLMDNIGIPIYNVRGNLISLLKTVSKQEQPGPEVPAETAEPQPEKEPEN